MTEVLTEVPETGTKLAFDSDREWDGAPRDATLRIRGRSRDGGAVLDMTMVEVDGEEATLVAWFMRQIRQPTPELIEKVAQEVQATFGARLSGRDAHQIADLCWKGLADIARERVSDPKRIEHLAERFERAGARSRAHTTAGVS